MKRWKLKKKTISISVDKNWHRYKLYGIIALLAIFRYFLEADIF